MADKQPEITGTCGHPHRSFSEMCDDCVAKLPPLSDAQALAGVPAGARARFMRSRREAKKRRRG